VGAGEQLISRVATRLRAGLLGLAAVLLAAAGGPAGAQLWQVQRLQPLVADTAGHEARVAVSPVGDPVRHVFIYVQPGGEHQLRGEADAVALSLSGPWTRAAPWLARAGVAVLYVDPPAGAPVNFMDRPAADQQAILARAVAHAQRLFPDAALHLAGFGFNAAAVLDAARALPPVQRIVLVAPAFANSRGADWSALRQPVLVFHAPGTQCDGAPFHESQWLARRHQWQFVEANYDQADGARVGCGAGSQHVLGGLQPAFAEAVSQWLADAPVPAAIGTPAPALPWREIVETFPVRRATGEDRLEVTLFLPAGQGPFPVVLFNHGDIAAHQPAIRLKQRLREAPLAREFLRLGIAVAVPQRRGVGLSTGTYPATFYRQDADPTYKARVHAEDILPAVEWARTRPELDGRVLLAGHSAGAYAAMHVAGMQPAGVVALLNFAGGRTDRTAATGPSALNRMMVEGFREFGRRVRVPTLFVFAENDSRYSDQTVLAAVDAFRQAGGNGRLLRVTGMPGDGHAVVTQPRYWRDAVAAFLAEAGLGVARP